MKRILTFLVLMVLFCSCEKIAPEVERELSVSFVLGDTYVLGQGHPIHVVDGPVDISPTDSKKPYSTFPEEICLYGLSGNKAGQLIYISEKTTNMPAGEYFVSSSTVLKRIGAFGGNSTIEYLGLKEEMPHIDFDIKPKTCIQVNGLELYGYPITIQKSGEYKLEVQAKNFILYSEKEVNGISWKIQNDHYWSFQKGAKCSYLGWNWWVSFSVPPCFLCSEEHETMQLQISGSDKILEILLQGELGTIQKVD